MKIENYLYHLEHKNQNKETAWVFQMTKLKQFSNGFDVLYSEKEIHGFGGIEPHNQQSIA